MTKLEKLAKAAIRQWCTDKELKPTTLLHCHPRAYVLGKAASGCLLVACPPMDCEPHIQKSKSSMQADGSTMVHLFDTSLRAGDWCSVAYVVMSGRQERVAIRAVV